MIFFVASVHSIAFHPKIKTLSLHTDQNRGNKRKPDTNKC